jgi:hypothetical protein
MNLKNKDLNENLKILSKKYFELKKKDKNNFLGILDNSEEYKKVIDILSLDKEAKELFFKKLREKDYDIDIGSPQEIIDDFLNKLGNITEDFKEAEFDKLYNSFECFLYDDYLEVNHYIHLYNYSQTLEIISLSPQIYIRKTIINEKREELDESHSDFIIPSCISDFVIEIKTIVKKEISDDISLRYSNNLEEYNKIINIFDIVLNSLRVLKKSSVFLSNRNVANISAFTSQSKITFISSNLKPIFEGDICQITEVEIEEFKSIFHFIHENSIATAKSKDEQRLRIAITRLNDGITRDSLIDRLIDYMIGLEALFLPDGNQELQYRLITRIAFNLEKEFGKRKQLYNEMKEYYDERSKGVHGDSGKLKKEDVNKVEEILRKSILTWKDDKSIFDPENLTYNFFK